jgi:hypothetical protein
MSPHAVLGVRADASADEIRRRYRELAKICHPDAGGDTAEFVRLQHAYHELLEEKSRPAAEAPAPAEDQTWHGDVAEPVVEETSSTSRPAWWDEIVSEQGRRPASMEDKRRNLYVEKALPDRSFLKLVLATLGAAIVVTLASCLKGGVGDLSACVGQVILFSTFLFAASAFSAAVGAGGDDKAFTSTYLGVLSLLALALIVAVPLPFLKPA